MFIDFKKAVSSDLDEARQLLRDGPEWMRLRCKEDGSSFVEGVQDALEKAFRETCELLVPHDWLIDHLADRLSDQGRLSARTVAAICREYGNRGG